MKRLIDQELRKWKESSGRKSLILRGARQVGKTFSVRQLGKTYADFYEINFEKRPELHSIFERNLDPVRILRDLSVDRVSPIRPGETLLFFDEIQICPQAILSLRYFYEEMQELHVIGAGFPAAQENMYKYSHLCKFIHYETEHLGKKAGN